MHPITHRTKRLRVDLTNSTFLPRWPSSAHCQGSSLTSTFIEVPPVADVAANTDDLRHRILTTYDGGCLNGQPEILVIGVSITRFIKLPCGITYCFSGCKVSDFSLHIPALLDRHPTVHTVIVHVGTNDIMSRQSIKLQSDFESLTLTLESLGKTCILTGPIPSPGKGSERFSRLLSLHCWLINFCTATGHEFVNNFDSFWHRGDLYKKDTIHPNSDGVNGVPPGSPTARTQPAISQADLDPPPVRHIPVIINNRPPKSVYHRKSAHNTNNVTQISIRNSLTGNPFTPAMFVLCNIRSLSNKSFILNYLILFHNLDLLLITETWLKPGDYSPLIELCPLDYMTFNLPRPTGGGGIAVVFKNNFICNQITWSTFNSFELLSFENVCTIKVCCLVVYRPPKPNDTFFYVNSDLITSVVLKYDRVIMAGDFNVHIDNVVYEI